MNVLNSLLKKDPNQATPLHYGAQQGFMKVCKLYQELIDVQDKHGETPIHYAVASSFYQSSNLLPFLISLTKNPNAPNFMKQTPLHVAIANEGTSPKSTQWQIQIISILAKTGQNLNLQDSQGLTPLHYAVSHYNEKMFEEIVNLIDPISSINVLDDDGMKPLDMALEDCNEHAVRVLTPLTEDLTIAEETRNHPAYVGNEKFLACLQIIDQQKQERETLTNTN